MIFKTVGSDCCFDSRTLWSLSDDYQFCAHPRTHDSQHCKCGNEIDMTLLARKPADRQYEAIPISDSQALSHVADVSLAHCHRWTDRVMANDYPICWNTSALQLPSELSANCDDSVCARE